MASATVVFAGLDFLDPLATVESALEAAAIATIRVALQSGIGDRGNETLLVQAAAQVVGPVVLAGFSLGARIAVRASWRSQTLGVLALGYPFHQPRDPRQRHGLEPLGEVAVPTLIVQGTRDSHGSSAAVGGYELPGAVAITWLEDANHRFVPRGGSPEVHRQHLARAAQSAVSFVHSLSEVR